MPSTNEKSESEFEWDTDCSWGCDCYSNSSSSWIDNKNYEISKSNEENFLQFDNCEDEILWPINNSIENENSSNNLSIKYESGCVDGSNHINASKLTEKKETKSQLVITKKRNKFKLLSDIKDTFSFKNMKK